MSDLAEHISALSPEKRELLLQKMQEKMIEQQVRQKQKGNAKQQILPQPRDGRTFSLSFAQERLWFLHQLDPQSVAYNIPKALRFRGDLFIAALERSLAMVIQRHEALRMVFQEREGGPVQVIKSSLSLPFPVVDLSRIPLSAQEDLVRLLSQQEALRPFDLTSGPLMRIMVLRLNEQEHVLLFTLHHIIFDGWSTGVLIQELSTLYRAEIKQKQASLPVLPIQYADYAHWQRELLQGEVLQRQIGYWQQQLTGTPTILNLPINRSRPARQTSAGAAQTMVLPFALLQELKLLSKQEGATLFMTLLASFQVLLMRYSGQQDIVVGSPIANRGQQELKNLIGLFVNTLVLRTDLSYNPSFQQLLARVRKMTLQAYEHQDLPFERLVEALHTERSLSHSPLFQVLFALQNVPQSGIKLDALTLQSVEMEQTISMLDLAIMTNESERGLEVVGVYNTDLFDASTIRRLLEHWRVLLQGIVTHPQYTLADLPLLTEAEQRMLLSTWNATWQKRTAPLGLHQLIEAQATAYPDAVAVIYEEQQLTYGELNYRANQLAHALIRRGVRADKCVGVCMERSLELVIALLGILKAGGAYVPLDPAAPFERLQWMLEDVQPITLLCQAQIVATKPLLVEHPTICLDTDWRIFEQEPGNNPECLVFPDQLAYVIYTSGSTGRPKGVMISHRSIHNSLLWLQEAYRLAPQESIIQKAAITFDISVQEIFWPLISGGRLVLARPDSYRDSPYILALTAQQYVTTQIFAPSVLIVALEEEGWEACDSLRRVLCGGETLSAELQTRFMDRYHVPVYNHYGPTETAIHASAWAGGERGFFAEPSILLSLPQAGGEAPAEQGVNPEPRLWIDPGSLSLVSMTPPRRDEASPSSPLQESCARPWVSNQQQREGNVPIGTPISNTQIYLLDAWASLVPVGVAGEIFIGGVNLARGYLGRPELTADSFVPHPFSTQPGERLYRTGDLARYREDGVLEYLGRVDQQIKLRGMRIELGEIEAVLRTHPKVQEAVVILQEEEPSIHDKRLIGYVTAVAGEQLDPRMLKTYLHERLPEAMVPTFFMILASFPLTVSNKIDRQALPPFIPDRLDEHESFVAPQTPLEELLASIWAELLHLPQVSIHENFFDLGGHSLLATQVMSRIRLAVSIELPLRTLFEFPTVAALALHIEGLMQVHGQRVLAPIRPQQRITDLPLSFAQERLWFLHKLEPESAAYHIPIILRLSGPLQIEAMERSLNTLTQRHEALRTTFHEKEDGPIQVVAHSMVIKIPVVDLQNLCTEEQDKLLTSLGKQEVECAFDLGNGPLLRVYLLRLAEQEHIAFFTMHHIIMDGWSISIVIRELSELYQAYIQGKVPDLPELPLQYADYALWQRENLREEFLAQQLAYWQEQLAGAPAVLPLPTDRPRSQASTDRGDTQAITIPPLLMSELKRLSQREGVTLFMLLLAALLVLLQRYSGQDDIVVGSSIANRTHKELEGLVGFFLNILVLRTDLSGNPSFHELLARVRETALEAYAHQEMPFEKLVEALDVERSRNISPLFQVLFVLQNTPQEELQLGECIWRMQEQEDTNVKYDLTVEVQEVESGLQTIVHYKTDLFDTATIRRLLEHWQVLLASIVRDVKQPTATLELLPEAERDLLVHQWSITQVQEPLESNAHRLFERQVELTPDSVALVCGDEQITYECFNQRANRLAHYLQRQGIKPEVRVGLCLEKGPLAVTGLLAVLKAGGTYVFLDPALPKARLTYMVQDACLHLVLTQQSLFPYMQDYEGTYLCYEQLWNVLQAEADLNPAVWLAASNLASITYTSGSTGFPKGVLSTHGGIVNYLRFLIQTYRLNSQMTVLQIPSLTFDASVRDIFGTLVAGGRLVLTWQQETKDLNAVLGLLQQHSVTHLLSAVPSFLRILLDTIESQEAMVHSVQLVLLSGENLLLALVARARRIFAENVTLVNQYGPTETTMTATYLPISAEVELAMEEDGSAKSGRPIPNMQIYLLDQQFQPVPIGVSGEVYLGGAGLARGYAQRADETAEKFLPHPFSSLPGQRLYRTGDRARYRSNGCLEYLGRIDHQIKIRGNRVELGEIERQLEQYPGVKQCVVLMREDHPGESQLVAYLLLDAEQRLAPATELRSFLQETLPDYMLPAYFIQIEGIPLTPNGKVDRRALPAPELQSASAGSSIGEPQTPLQRRLADIWAELLHRPQVGIHENFFQIGGHSLLATLLMTHVHATFEVAIPLRSLFDAPTIAEMARTIEQTQIAKMQERIAKQEDEAEIDRILSALEALSDDAIESSL